MPTRRGLSTPATQLTKTAVRTLASLAGFAPRIAHQIDSLDLVEDLIIAGYGVGLLPIGRPTSRGVKVFPLAEPKPC